MILLIAFAGCDGVSEPGGSRSRTGERAVLPAPYASLRDHWQAYLLEGKRVGMGHVAAEVVQENGRDVVHVSGYVKLGFTRGGVRNDVEVREEAWETLAGELLRFRSLVDLGGGLIVSEGEPHNGRLVLKNISGGQTRRMDLDWTPQDRGPLGMEWSLAAAPLKPGETRHVRVLQPIFHQVADMRLAAQDWEQAELLEGSARLLKIAVSVELPGGQRSGFVVWCDVDGVIHKREEQPGLVSFRTSREKALESGDAAPDLLALSIARIGQEIARPLATTRARYRVRLKDDNPATVFPRDARQRVREVDDRVAELTISSDAAPAEAATPETPGPADRGPSALVESDDPLIRRLAAEAAGRQTDERLAALALERFVHDRIVAKNFSQAFSSAATVAKSLEGDCTEHAVLLAALARARGLPARVVMGLIYVPEEQGFGYHMWNEVFVQGEWLALDATLGLGRVSATHIKVATSSLDEASAWASFLPVARVLGQSELETLELGYE